MRGNVINGLYKIAKIFDLLNFNSISIDTVIKYAPLTVKYHFIYHDKFHLN
jgi:hypothetical protein